jgi:hypothetical protein
MDNGGSHKSSLVKIAISGSKDTLLYSIPVSNFIAWERQFLSSKEKQGFVKLLAQALSALPEEVDKSFPIEEVTMEKFDEEFGDGDVPTIHTTSKAAFAYWDKGYNEEDATEEESAEDGDSIATRMKKRRRM